MRALAADCGDVPPLPEWREEMHHLILDIMTKFPETYKDIEMNDHICFHQAKQEFDAIRANMKSDPQKFQK